MRLFIASVLTLLLLSTFLAAIFFAFLYTTGFIDIYWLFGLVILVNFVMWLIGPWISDWIYKFLYKLQWVSLSELKARSPAAADQITKVCTRYNFPIPKLGIIPDKNPNAFTYGSGRWNGRIVVTEGIFEYLDEKERASVYAHELGHIKNRDFIIMTIASTLLQLIYEMYVVFRRMGTSRGGGRKGGGKVVFLGLALVSYIFYWVGQYVVLYLSRIREYFADEFAAKESDANWLSSALVKIAYGILANPDDPRLVKATKHMGIADFKLAEGLGIVYYNCSQLKNFDPLHKALLYDIKNPWAILLELGSTHPLTGKRLRRLSTLTSKPMFDFAQIEAKNPVDSRKMYSLFFKDVAVLSLPTILAVGFPLVYAAAFIAGYVDFMLGAFLGLWLASIGAGGIITTLYKYPGGAAKTTNVMELLSDLYASPVRGTPVALKGKLIGRGVPGLIFSEDMVMQDKTGLMYLNYESWLPVIGNLFFGLLKLPALLNKDAAIDGWFLRGTSSVVGLKKLTTSEGTVNGFVKLGGLIGGALIILVGIALMIYL